MIEGSPIPIRPADRAFRHPYIVRTPPYARRSAGIRVLHWLCDALNRLGAQAWVDVSAAHGVPGADPAGGVYAGLAAPPLTLEHRAALLAGEARPIVIHPEVFEDVWSQGLSVRYLLNFAGLMGGAAKLARCDLTVAYSETIRRQEAGCQDVLFIPGSDPRWWTPPPPSALPSQQRRQALIYAGKYIEHHKQSFPLHLRDAVRVGRHGPDSPNSADLRDMLRKGALLYVFENTAVAAEAALCGCPVVLCYNWFFRELIAGHELGFDGFTTSDRTYELEEARASLGQFRARYQEAIIRVEPALLDFVEKTQSMASWN